MIEIKNLKKAFGSQQALEGIDLTIKENSVFGLVGTNGAGKSTLLRLIAGVYKPDKGEVLVDGEKAYDNPKAKREMFFIADDHYYYNSGTPKEMMEFYATYYVDFQKEKWHEMMKSFGLSEKARISSMSKGMKKQLSLLYGICSNTKYLLCDETFDGLDPVMRQGIKKLLIKEMDERGLTPVIASHNLRELEDFCEYVGLLHRGSVLLDNDLEGVKEGIHKIQCVIKDRIRVENIKATLQPVLCENRGSLYMLTVRGDLEKIREYLELQNLPFYEVLPLSLEEIFICETEVKGYDIKELLL